MMAMDYMLKYVMVDNRKDFCKWGKWWDNDFSLYAFYDNDLLKTFHDYAKGK